MGRDLNDLQRPVLDFRSQLRRRSAAAAAAKWPTPRGGGEGRRLGLRLHPAVDGRVEVRYVGLAPGVESQSTTCRRWQLSGRMRPLIGRREGERRVNVRSPGSKTSQPNPSLTIATRRRRSWSCLVEVSHVFRRCSTTPSQDASGETSFKVSPLVKTTCE